MQQPNLTMPRGKLLCQEGRYNAGGEGVPGGGGQRAAGLFDGARGKAIIATRGLEPGERGGQVGAQERDRME